MLQAILFDLDGTLTDPGLGVTRCLAYALTELGLPVPPDRELAAGVGPPIRETIARLLGGGAPAEVEQALAIYRRRYGVVGMFENEVYPGVRAMLDRVRDGGARLYVATSKALAFTRPILDHFGLTGYFAGIFGPELSGRFDDKTELVAHLLEQTRLDAGRTAIVGDRRFDVVAGHAHGLVAVGVTYGYGSRDELTEARADVLCDSPEQVADWIGSRSPVPAAPV